jgi:drug/metabolite transporter (DMT)-like permease
MEKDDPSRSLLNGRSGSDAEDSSAGGWMVGRKLIVLVFVGLLAFSVGNSIFFKKMTNHMPNYPFFLCQVTNLVYIPIFFAVVEWEKRHTDRITPAMTSFPKRHFAVMGTADALAGVLMLFGGVHSTGGMQALLANLVIPFTMVLTIVVLRSRFRWNQYLGALTIMAGATVVLLPSFQTEESGGNWAIFNMIFLASTVPQAFSAVYKEIAFSKVEEMEVNYLQFWVAVFQLLFGFLLIPLNTFKFLGANYISWSDLMPSMYNGLKCLGGVNVIVDHCWKGPEAPKGMSHLPPCDNCEGAWLPLALYLLFNILYSIFTVLAIKHTSASVMYVLSTLRLPLVQLSFAFSFVQNPPDPVTWEAIVGLVVTIAGLIAYRWVPEATPMFVEGDMERPQMCEDASINPPQEPTRVLVLGGGGASGSGGIDILAMAFKRFNTPKFNRSDGRPRSYEATNVASYEASYASSPETPGTPGRRNSR